MTTTKSTKKESQQTLRPRTSEELFDAMEKAEFDGTLNTVIVGQDDWDESAVTTPVGNLPDKAGPLETALAHREALFNCARMSSEELPVEIAYGLGEGPQVVYDASKLLGLGDSHDVISKADLVGIAFAITNYHFYEGNFGTTVAVTFVDADGKVGVFNDGSTGVLRQLLELHTDFGHPLPIFCKKGLSGSSYTYTDENDHAIPATTYYLT